MLVGDGLFRALLSPDCEILPSEFPLLSRSKQQGDKIFPNPPGCLLIGHTDKDKSRMSTVTINFLMPTALLSTAVSSPRTVYAMGDSLAEAEVV